MTARSDSVLQLLTETAADPNRTVILKGGFVVSMDSALGDHQADVRVTGNRIDAVGPGLAEGACNDVVVIDATGCIVLPGLVDSHLHAWEGQLRGSDPAADFGEYMTITHGGVAEHMTPEDIAIGQRITAAQAINNGVTTIVDNSHNSRKDLDMTTTALPNTRTGQPTTPQAVVERVTALVPVLRSRARETEQLKHMHPDNLKDLTQAGVFKLTLPKSHGGYEAGPREITEVLAQIARGCPSTSWICSIISAVNVWPALLPDEGANEIYATPDLRGTGLISPTGKAVSVDGGVRVDGTWMWNTGGVHSQWLGLAAMLGTGQGPLPITCLVRAEEVESFQTWDASGMSGTATNKVVAENLFVPQRRIIPVPSLGSGEFPQRQFSGNPYYNRPIVQLFTALTAPTMLGIARGAMDVYMERLPSRGITYTNYAKAIEAPLTHHQVATAQLRLDTAEQMMRALEDLLLSTWDKEVPLENRIRTRAWLGHIVRNAKACVNTLFEASGASAIQHSSDIQRYFRDANSLNLHALIQPTSSDELYGRMLCGLEPNTTFL